MKTPITLFAAVCCLLLAAGCNKESQSSENSPANAADKATATAQGQTEVVVKQTTQDAAATAPTQPAAATNLAQDAGTAAQAQAPAATDKAQGVIDQAKKLLADNKASEALTSLNGLSSLQLTPDQQSAVQNLKDQIQKALAAKATGGLLPTK
jgi:hypothetical protein